jgi:hypothetical protein
VWCLEAREMLMPLNLSAASSTTNSTATLSSIVVLLFCFSALVWLNYTMLKALKNHTATKDKTFLQLNKDKLHGLAMVVGIEIEDDDNLTTLRRRLKPTVDILWDFGFDNPEYKALFCQQRRGRRTVKDKTVQVFSRFEKVGLSLVNKQ